MPCRSPGGCRPRQRFLLGDNLQRRDAAEADYRHKRRWNCHRLPFAQPGCEAARRDNQNRQRQPPFPSRAVTTQGTTHLTPYAKRCILTRGAALCLIRPSWRWCDKCDTVLNLACCLQFIWRVPVTHLVSTLEFVTNLSLDIIWHFETGIRK